MIEEEETEVQQRREGEDCWPQEDKEVMMRVDGHWPQIKTFMIFPCGTSPIINVISYLQKC